MTIPTPKWSIGAVTIFVDEYSGGQKPVVGELHVLDANNSTKHFSGSMGKTRRIAGTLYDTDGSKLNTLQGYTEAEVRELMGDKIYLRDGEIAKTETAEWLGVRV